MRAPRLRAFPEARRGSAVFTNMLIGTDPPRGRPVGGGGVHRKKLWGIKHSITYIRLMYFHGKYSKYFLNTLLGLMACSASAPVAVAAPWNNNFREC